MLFISAIAASMDSFVIGISLKLNKMKLHLLEILEMSLGSFITILFFHILLNTFHIQIHHKFTKFILFILLGILSLKKEKKKIPYQALNQKDIFLIILSNSIDGFLISLTFINQYSYIFLSFIYSFSGIFLLILGNSFSINIKKSDLISTTLFFLLALISLF